MYLEDKILFIRLNKFDFYKLSVNGFKNPVATKYSNILKKEYNYSNTSTPDYLLPPFVKLFKKMFPQGPYGEEVTITDEKLAGHWRKSKQGNKIPNIITSGSQVPFI